MEQSHRSISALTLLKVSEVIYTPYASGGAVIAASEPTVLTIFRTANMWHGEENDHMIRAFKIPIPLQHW